MKKNYLQGDRKPGKEILLGGSGVDRSREIKVIRPAIVTISILKTALRLGLSCAGFCDMISGFWLRPSGEYYVELPFILYLLYVYVHAHEYASVFMQG